MALRPQPSSSRGGARVRLIAIHTAEGARTVESLDSYFRRTRSGSSHAGADDKRLVEGWVPYGRASWTLRNGNPVSDNLELCAFAGWSRAEWVRHDDMLTHAARWIAQRCEARGIPCRKLTPAEVRAGKSGVIGHHDWTIGMKDGTHWDPGPNFPWDVVMGRARRFLSGDTPSPPLEPEPEPTLLEDCDMFLAYDQRFGVFWAITPDFTSKSMIHPSDRATVEAGWRAQEVKYYGPVALQTATLDRIPDPSSQKVVKVAGTVGVDLVDGGHGDAQ